MMMMAMMKSCLSGLSLLLLLFIFIMSSSVASQLNSVVKKYYKHYTRHYSWSEAQSFCRSHHTDLAVFSKSSELDGLQLSRYNAWIGLFKKTHLLTQESWTWTSSNDFTSTRWAANEPDNKDECAYVSYPSQLVYGTNCEAYHFFLCHHLNLEDPQLNLVPLSTTWSKAEIYCRTRQEVLANFTREADLSNIAAANFSVWIGHHSENGDTWKWSASSSVITDWGPGQVTEAAGQCVSLLSNPKHMCRQDCSHRLPFVCLGDNVLLVKEKKTWEEALQHCRALNSTRGGQPGYDLLSVQPGEDHQYAMAKASSAETEEVWVGLRFLAGSWLWVDGAAVSYGGLPSCPEDWRHCGVLSRNNGSSVETKACSETRNFLCYRK